MLTRRQLLLGTLVTATATAAHAQQLAHAGWRGNGMAPEAWWQHAALVRLPDDITFADAAKSFDAMSEVGADSLLLPDLQPTPTQPFAARFGTEDDLDTLLREAAARRMHLLLRMPMARAADNPGEVRFWMNHGIAGFDLGTLTSAEMETAVSLRAALDRYPGRRILLARTPTAPAPAASSRRHNNRTAADPVTLHILSAQDAGAGGWHPPGLTAVEIAELPADAADVLRPAERSAEPLPGAVPQLRSLLPLLLAPGAPILDSRLLVSADGRHSLQQVLALRSTHAVLRAGVATPLSTLTPLLHAWLLRSHSSQEVLLLVSNESNEAVTLHLTAALAAQGVRSEYLRPLLRSDHGMGSVDVEQGTLLPHAALLADIHFDRYSTDSGPAMTKQGHHRR